MNVLAMAWSRDGLCIKSEERKGILHIGQEERVLPSLLSSFSTHPLQNLNRNRNSWAVTSGGHQEVGDGRETVHFLRVATVVESSRRFEHFTANGTFKTIFYFCLQASHFHKQGIVPRVVPSDWPR